MFGARRDQRRRNVNARRSRAAELQQPGRVLLHGAGGIAAGFSESPPSTFFLDPFLPFFSAFTPSGSAPPPSLHDEGYTALKPVTLSWRPPIVEFSPVSLITLRRDPRTQRPPPARRPHLREGLT